MAWSVSVVDKTVLGNKRVEVLSCVADSAEQNITMGFNYIDYFITGPKSLSTGAPHLFHNKNSTGAAANGTLGASGFVSGDELLITVFGK